MNTNEIITIDELFKVIETDSDNYYRTLADRLLEAFTDWPTENLKNPADMLLELRTEIKGPLTCKNLCVHLKTLHPDFDAWKMESIYGLLKIFELSNVNEDSETDLIDILHKLTKHYRS